MGGSVWLRALCPQWAPLLLLRVPCEAPLPGPHAAPSLSRRATQGAQADPAPDGRPLGATVDKVLLRQGNR